MFRIVIADDQSRAFMECQDPPVSEAEVFECFPKDFTLPANAEKELQMLTGKTSNGRLLQVHYKYISWTNEVVVYAARDV